MNAFAPYEPDHNAPAFGRWDRAGGAVRWVQDHRALVVQALHSWKGSPTDMVLQITDELARAPMPDSGSGKKLREQARALRWELQHHSKPSPTLYRGSHQRPAGLQPWSSRRKVAELWASRNGGDVWELPKGTRGLKIADYLGEDPEFEWVVALLQGSP